MRVRIVYATGFYFDKYGRERPARLVVVYPAVGPPRILYARCERTEAPIPIADAFLERKQD